MRRCCARVSGGQVARVSRFFVAGVTTVPGLPAAARAAGLARADEKQGLGVFLYWQRTPQRRRKYF